MRSLVAFFVSLALMVALTGVAIVQKWAIPVLPSEPDLEYILNAGLISVLKKNHRTLNLINEDSTLYRTADNLFEHATRGEDDSRDADASTQRHTVLSDSMPGKPYIVLVRLLIM